MASEEPTATVPRPTPGSPDDRKPAWPALMAFLTAWLLPATTAKRTARVSLLWAYAVHILAALLTFFLIIFLSSLSIQDSVFEVLSEIAEEFERDPGEATLVTLIICTVVELGFLGLALLVLPWGACDERLRSSWAHALRHTWLHTTHALPVVLVIGLAIVQYDRIHSEYWTRNRLVMPTTWPTPPSYPQNAAPNSQQMKDYNAAMQEYQKQFQSASKQWNKTWTEYRKRRPFLVKYGGGFIGYGCFGAATWILWALFRAVGIRRQKVPVTRAPMCEFCGYNLIGTAADSRCPECGEWVTASLGDDVRTGSLWDRRHEAGWWRAWWRCCVDAVFRGRHLGRQLRINPPSHAGRGFLMMHLAPIFLICGIGIILCIMVIEDVDILTEEDGLIVWGVAPLVGYFSSLTALCLALISASLIGMLYTVQRRRNLLPAAMQVASYLGGYLVAWACFASVSGVVAFALIEADALDAWEDILRIEDEVLAFFGWFLLNLLWVGAYLLLVWRGTAGAQYANR